MFEGSQRPEHADNSTHVKGTGEDSTMQELRELILGSERLELDHLKERLGNPETRAHEVAAIVASALEQAARDDEARLTEALLKPVESALRRSTQGDPQGLADALFPVMGPAIRKAIVETVRGMIDSTNRAIAASLSWERLQWRIEAMRTGKSFAEIALTRGLLFRVEQLLLIHRETGLLLHKVALSDVETQNADMVSGMLTAIRDFVSDSFGAAPGESVSVMQVGELEVIVQDSPHAVLAAVVRGHPPHELTVALQEALEKIHRIFAVQLGNFDGDAEVFAEANDLLEDCLWSQRREKKGTGSRARLRAVWGAGVLLLIIGLGWMVANRLEARRWAGALAVLEGTPGVIVTSVAREQGIRVVNGLQDPYADDPTNILEGSGIEAGGFRLELEPYQSLDAEMVKWRLGSYLGTPSTLSTSIRNGIFFAEGSADDRWPREARLRLNTISLVDKYEFSGVAVLLPADMTATIERIRRLQVFMERCSTRIRTESLEAVTRLSEQITRLLAQVAESGRPMAIEIIGHTDRSGTETANLHLSARRALRVRDLLVENGIPNELLGTRGIGSQQYVGDPDDEQAAQHSRRVSLRVDVGDVQWQEEN